MFSGKNALNHGYSMTINIPFALSSDLTKSVKFFGTKDYF